LQVKVKGGDNVQVILGAIGPFWEKWGLGRVLRSEGCFSCVANQTTFQELLPNLVTKRISVSRRGIRKDIKKNFHFSGHFPPKSEIGQTGTSLRAGYRSWDALQRDTVYSML